MPGGSRRDLLSPGPLTGRPGGNRLAKSEGDDQRSLRVHHALPLLDSRDLYQGALTKRPSGRSARASEPGHSTESPGTSGDHGRAKRGERWRLRPETDASRSLRIAPKVAVR